MYISIYIYVYFCLSKRLDSSSGRTLALQSQRSCAWRILRPLGYGTNSDFDVYLCPYISIYLHTFLNTCTNLCLYIYLQTLSVSVSTNIYPYTNILNVRCISATQNSLRKIPKNSFHYRRAFLHYHPL